MLRIRARHKAPGLLCKCEWHSSYFYLPHLRIQMRPQRFQKLQRLTWDGLVAVSILEGEKINAEILSEFAH